MMPRMARPTLDQVAARARVSRATASRAVNGDRWVSESARLAVEQAVQDLGWTAHQAARSLATRRAGSIALLVPEPDDRVRTDAFLAGMQRALNRSAGRRDLQLLVMMLPEDATGGRMMRYLSGGHCDGVVLVSHHRGDDLVAALDRLGQPVVLVGRPFADEVPLPFVDVDNQQGGRLAAAHLLDLGRRHLATVTGPPDMVAGADRLAGWQQELAARSASGLVAEADFTRPGAREAVTRLLDEQPTIDALFVASDQMAEGALLALAARGRRVPDDVAVVGFDDFDTAEELGLTTLVNPVADLAEGALGTLERIADDEPVGGTVFPTRLVRRQTT